MKINYEKLGVGLFFGMVFIAGYFTHLLIIDYSVTKLEKQYDAKIAWCENISDRKIDGLWLYNYNESMKDNITQTRDSRGEWVCVNIQGMTYNRAVEVCQHEVGHEMFAEICEKNMSKCLGVMNG